MLFEKQLAPMILLLPYLSVAEKDPDMRTTRYGAVRGGAAIYENSETKRMHLINFKALMKLCEKRVLKPSLIIAKGITATSKTVRGTSLRKKIDWPRAATAMASAARSG